MVLHGLLSNRGKVSEEGSDCVLEVETLESSLNYQVIVVFPWPENTNVERL